jgi:hypothetical protein
VLSIATKTTKSIIAAGAIIVSVEEKRKRLQKLDGKKPVIGKKICATAVGLVPNIQLSWWCIMWMET